MPSEVAAIRKNLALRRTLGASGSDGQDEEISSPVKVRSGHKPYSGERWGEGTLLKLEFRTIDLLYTNPSPSVPLPMLGLFIGSDWVGRGKSYCQTLLEMG